jgi:hypothetical protein
MFAEGCFFTSRQLCSAVSADGVEEYTGLSESSSRRALNEFCKSVVRHLSNKYRRQPTLADLSPVETVYISKGFPGCIDV